jgi:hypothetical protein
MKHTIKLLLGALLLLGMTAACDTTELHDMNLNPNAVLSIDMNYFFTACCLGTASNGTSGDNRYTDWRTNVGTCAHAVQQLATTATGGIGGDGDKYMDGYVEGFNAPFQFMYRDVGRRAEEVIKQTSEGGTYEGKLVNTKQACRILRAFNYFRLTDWYGSVPFTEANKGLEGIFQPKYDKQRTIYTELLKELDEACAGFNAADADYANFKKADIIYGGDIAKWKKFGYSLMLRYAMRVSNVDKAGLATTYVNKAIAGGTMASNDDVPWIMMTISPSEWTNQNGISRGFWPGDGGQWSASFLSKTLMDKLKGTDPNSVADDDPRLTIFTKGPIQWTANDMGTVLEADPTKWIGLPNGKDQSQINNELFGGTSVENYKKFCAVNPLMLQDDEPYQIAGAAESEFLKAEAIVRGIGSVPGTAKDHYEAGVKLAMQVYVKHDASFAVSDAKVAAYLTQYPYDPAKALEQIGTQLWISKWFNWWDSWCDVRRSGYPVLTPTNYVGNATGGKFMRKLLIPAAEASGNPNYASGATLPDKLDTKVWWDGGAE